jgi:hypothetical protein
MVGCKFVYQKKQNNLAMKSINIIYWTSTILFGGFMAFSAIANIIVDADSVNLITTQLGYPKYLISFLGVAKLLGAIGILVPGFPRIKEWAYAGLTFDLIGAVYSGIAVYGFQPPMLFMLVFFGMDALSYIYYHKKYKGV